LGTVGLSLGITPHLSMASKFIIVLLMLIGRIGPLTLSMSFFAGQSGRDFNYPEGRILT
jgi:trk system potassium uptake protein TrkH